MNVTPLIRVDFRHAFVKFRQSKFVSLSSKFYQFFRDLMYDGNSKELLLLHLKCICINPKEGKKNIE